MAAFAAGYPAGGFPVGDAVQAAVGIVQAIADMPNVSDAGEEQMAQSNAREFEANTPLWNDTLLETYLRTVSAMSLRGRRARRSSPPPGSTTS